MVAGPLDAYARLGLAPWLTGPVAKRILHAHHHPDPHSNDDIHRTAYTTPEQQKHIMLLPTLSIHASSCMSSCLEAPFPQARLMCSSPWPESAQSSRQGAPSSSEVTPARHGQSRAGGAGRFARMAHG